MFFCVDVPLTWVPFSVFLPRHRVLFLQKLAPRQGLYLSFLTLKCRCRPFTIHECDLNHLDGNISTFSDGFLTKFEGRAQYCQKKLKDRVLF